MFGWRREGCRITASPDLNTSNGREVKEEIAFAGLSSNVRRDTDKSARGGVPRVCPNYSRLGVSLTRVLNVKGLPAWEVRLLWEDRVTRVDLEYE
jgi:hypothetical protein